MWMSPLINNLKDAMENGPMMIEEPVTGHKAEIDYFDLFYDEYEIENYRGPFYQIATIFMDEIRMAAENSKKEFEKIYQGDSFETDKSIYDSLLDICHDAELKNESVVATDGKNIFIISKYWYENSYVGLKMTPKTAKILFKLFENVGLQVEKFIA